MTANRAKITYTITDESPALATSSLLPILCRFLRTADIEVETRDISLAARILAQFPDYLSESQRQSDDLLALGAFVKDPEANIIKLPNISASIPQLKAAIKELQEKGFAIPDFPETPGSDLEKEIWNRYAKILGSAVNPILREGNSDRRVAAAVKAYAQAHPHSLGEWTVDSRSHVAHMTEGDFYGSEQSVIITQKGYLRVEYVDEKGRISILKNDVSVDPGDVVDASCMSCKALRHFFAKEMESAKKDGLLLSLHLKATMMKISDPVIFGHAVDVFYEDLFNEYADLFENLGFNPNNGIADLYAKLQQLPEDQANGIQASINKVYEKRPRLAMVDSAKGITNLHAPNNVIIDASMPAMLRNGGKMWSPDGTLKDTKALIPDRCYAGVYQESIRFCQEYGAFDPRTMGNVSNVGLMAQKAEEYGSHDKTFIASGRGYIRVLDSSAQVLMEHEVDQGDIWRMCQVKDIPVRDWVRLAVDRARITGNPAVFWLDEKRAHDRKLIQKVKCYLQDHDTNGLDISIKNPVEATRYTMIRCREGKDTISVTGNVLRDYLTDLFPILELGSSSKMLSIVPLLAGGGLFETGAGGSAPDLTRMFLEKGHFCWDSLGEFLAIAASLEELARKTDSRRIRVLGEALNYANDIFLKNDKGPKRDIGGLDTRGSHFYWALYWAQALAEQEDDLPLKTLFESLAKALSENESLILDEMKASVGSPQDIGGYYYPDHDRLSQALRPSKILNVLIDSFG